MRWKNKSKKASNEKQMTVHTNNVPFGVRGTYDLEYVESNDPELSLCAGRENRDDNQSIEGL